MNLSGGKLARALPTLILCAALLVALTSVGMSQQLGLPNSPVLTLESDRLFTDSAFGQRVATEIEAESAVLAAENRRIEAELGAEERDLTDRRNEMEPEAFRALAEAFDQKVRSNRQSQDAKARELTQNADQARGEFLRAVRPVLEAMMRETGATVIMDRSTVILSAGAVDITDLAIARIDAAIGDGARDETPDD